MKPACYSHMIIAVSFSLTLLEPGVVLERGQDWYLGQVQVEFVTMRTNLEKKCRQWITMLREVMMMVVTHWMMLLMKVDDVGHGDRGGGDPNPQAFDRKV